MYDVTTVNPNFDPQHSTNEIWRDEDGLRCLTDDLDQIELDIANLETEVNNKAPTDHNHTGFAPSTHTHQSADVAGLADTLTAKADLVNGKVPDTQLPGCVPEIERATSFTALPITGDVNKLYITTDNDKAYRWNGTGYSEISESLAIGETANTAFRGDHGKTAYDHSQAGDVHVTAEQKNTWNDKANGDHNHDTSYSKKDIQIVSDTGSFKYAYRNTDNVNVLDAIKALPSGMFTVYSQGGVAGNPKTAEAWRMLVHKTGNTVLWVKAFGSAGSEYSNYCADGNWQGWRCIYDDQPQPLWSGAMYMTGTHEIIPTKPLSDCAHGWLLLWSDYNAGDGLQNVDFATTMIPKRAYSGQTWNGSQWLCVVPRFADSTGDATIVKALHIHDSKIVGNDINSVSPRNDVVLRAVYEF